jgi:phosphatidylglycerophosphate synthase
MGTELLEIMLWSGLVALLLLGIPKRTLRFLGNLALGSVRPLGPNWITTYSIVVTLIGMWIYTFHPIAGFVVVVVGSILDRLDGKMAMALGNPFPNPKPFGKGFFTAEGFRHWWAEFNHNGPTDLGMVYDPFGDKVKSFSILFYFVFQGILCPWLVWILVLPELIGTLIRPPFNLLQSLVGKTKATGIGKYKVMAQWTTIILCVPVHQRWIDSAHWANGLDKALDWLMGLIVVLAIASVVSRFKWTRRQRELKDVLDSLEKSTEHEE